MAESKIEAIRPLEQGTLSNGSKYGTYINTTYTKSYSKVGRLAIICLAFTLNAAGSTSGWQEIFTLPFTAVSDVELIIVTGSNSPKQLRVSGNKVYYNILTNHSAINNELISVQIVVACI